jgi:AraC family transcriptional regulator of adaptative response/methylated-DNA-[protein]-cysteine methyltransferase
MTMQNPATPEREGLRFAYDDTALGTIMVAESAQGIVALFIGDSRPNLLRDLEQTFPEANLVLDQATLKETTAKVVNLINDPHLGTDLILDLRGSPTEVAVWKALREIPPGSTRTYGEMAKSLPMPATPQDVGAACAANRIAVAVPCHRVVKSDGSIAGYRWGVHRKRRLINKEAVW